MSKMFGLCVIAATLMAPMAVSFAQNVPNYTIPFTSNKAPSGLAEKAREAATRTLNAHCMLTEAHRQAAVNSNEAANKLIQDAKIGYSGAAEMFLGISKSLNRGIALNPPLRDDIVRAAGWKLLPVPHAATPGPRARLMA